MSELIKRHWWLMIITIPLLAYAIFHLTRRTKRTAQQGALLSDTRLTFVVSSLLVPAMVSSLLTARDEFNIRVETVFLLLFVFNLNWMYFDLYSKAKKLSEPQTTNRDKSR